MFAMKRCLGASTLVMALLCTTPHIARGADAQSPTTDAGTLSNAELLRMLKAMEQRVKSLEAQVQRNNEAATAPVPALAPAATSAPAAPPLRVTAAPASPAPAAAPSSTPTAPPAQPAAAAASGATANDQGLFGLYPSPIEGLKFGAYGELKVGSMQNPAANGQWQNGFDGGRLVLLPSYALTDRIIFNAEIEFEHGGTGFDNDDKLHGTAEIEQAFIDFKVRDYLNFHSPGIDLVPIGRTNLYHEPTTFYSVQRPELANGLIPTTFYVPSWGTAYGRIADGLEYRFQVSSSLEDFGDSFDNRTDANTATPGPYAAGIDGKNALAFSRPPVGDFRQLNNNLAYAARLAYDPPFAPGLSGSTSVYFTPNVEPRGAHSDVGTFLGGSNLTILDSELLYRIPKTGWELRGEYAQVFFGNPANLRANNDTDPTDNVGSTMWGLSGEVAYHVPIGSALGGDWEAVPFYRYTYEDLQTGGVRGTDANAPSGAGRVQFHTVGVAVFPTPKLVMKLNYQHIQDGETGGAKSDSILGAVGFFF
ncbi:MAG TPA: hypothetical protein VMB81_01670 [Candidatus Sulfotelmatobacter sp.]|nr:hypothetical protein [Candidatus Sulfotelmatobacter sp.]